MYNMDVIPVQWIRDQIEDMEYIMARAVPKVQESYRKKIENYKSLLSNWETFGPSWVRREQTSH